jgi:hypothetical protein
MSDKPVSFNLHLPISLELLAEVLSSVGNKDGDLVELIKKIDENVADWDFTLALASYFEEMRLEWATEFPEAAKEIGIVTGLVDDDTD